MSTIGEVIAKLSVLDPDTPANFFSEEGITSPTITELVAWEARHKENEALPGVAMASGRGACFLILLPHGLRSFDVVDAEIAEMERVLGEAWDASFTFAKGPGAVSNPMWGILGEATR